VTLVMTGEALVGGASVTLGYDPARVRLPGAGGGDDVRARVTDLTAGLFSKGAPNNLDGDDPDTEPEHVRFTIVSKDGVKGAILRITFDRCVGAAPTAAADYACMLDPKVVDPDFHDLDGVTCTLAVTHSP
jgi:hypothetical protein